MNTKPDRSAPTPTRERVMYVGSQAGGVEHLPPGYALAPCADCGHQVWTNGSMLNNYELIVVCEDCAYCSSA